MDPKDRFHLNVHMQFNAAREFQRTQGRLSESIKWMAKIKGDNIRADAEAAFNEAFEMSAKKEDIAGK
jgi:hypothetical protein